MRAREEYVRDKGIAIGKTEDILELLAVMGTVPRDLEQFIKSEKDILRLSRWHTIAAKTNSIEEFKSKK